MTPEQAAIARYERQHPLQRQATVTTRVKEIVRQYRAEEDGKHFAEAFAAVLTGTAPTANVGWANLTRAAQHVISDVHGQADDATHAVWPALAANTWALPLADTWLTAAMPVTSALNGILAIDATTVGVPKLPKVTTPPSAGPQNGDKADAYSKAFNIDPDLAAPLIDATLTLNISLQAHTLEGPLVEAIMRAAVAFEAERQIVAAIEAAATTSADLAAGFASFTGRYVPTLLVVPTSDVLALSAHAALLATLGTTTVLSTTATKTLLVDPTGVIGWLHHVEPLAAAEPALLGRSLSYALWGQVSVTPTAVAAITAAP